jgi:probable phosphoglycerate mutase
VDDIWLARHGATAWSVARRHTSTTDLDLIPEGIRQATELGRRLADHRFTVVLSSPLLRARRTAELAGFGTHLELDDDLMEFRYGDYEGVTTADIIARRPGWNLWTDGCPGGETATDVGRRADSVLTRLKSLEGSVLLFGHGHALRILAARWLGLGAEAGQLLALDAATLSILGLEHRRPVVKLWNDGCHLVER